LAQLLRRRQIEGENVNDFAQAFEGLFEDSYGQLTDIDSAFKEMFKRNIFVKGLVLKWLEKIL